MGQLNALLLKAMYLVQEPLHEKTAPCDNRGQQGPENLAFQNLMASLGIQ